MAKKTLDIKKANKLKQVNVPEMFYQVFMSKLPSGTSTIADKLKNISPTPRGRGMSRVVKNITLLEWEDLYSYAAKARASICGCDRTTELKPAICGKALAIRMEELGVASPVNWSPSKIYKPRKVFTEADFETNVEDDDDDDEIVNAISVPITIPTAEDVAEPDDEELEMINAEVQQQKS